MKGRSWFVQRGKRNRLIERCGGCRLDRAGGASRKTGRQPLLCDFFHKVVAAMNVRSLEVLLQCTARIGRRRSSRTPTVKTFRQRHRKFMIPRSEINDLLKPAQRAKIPQPVVDFVLVIDQKDKQSSLVIASERFWPPAFDSPASTRRSKRAFSVSHHLSGKWCNSTPCSCGPRPAPALPPPTPSRRPSEQPSTARLSLRRNRARRSLRVLIRIARGIALRGRGPDLMRLR
jgi:hypothetical protein